MRLLRMLPSALAALLIPLTAAAADIYDLSGQSRTYLLYREATDTSKLLPIYEYLDFRAADPKGSVSFNIGGWYRQDLKGPSTDDRSDGDLQYAYLSLRRKTGNGILNLGRFRVSEGVAADLVDGAYARTDLKGGFGISLYGGSPVVESTVTSSLTTTISAEADMIYGGRISHTLRGIYSIGLSYLGEQDGGAAFRREEGVDLWLRPFHKLELQGLSSYNDISRNWMVHNYYLTVGPFAGLRLIGTGSRISYKDYFTGTTLSAFTFPSIDPDETVTALGGSVEYTFPAGITVIADYKNYEYKIAGHAGYYGGRLTYAGGTVSAGAGIHRMNGDDDSLRYDEQSLYVTKNISKADVSLQGVHVAFDRPISNVKDSYTASAAAGYSFTSRVRAVADVEYTKSPDYDKDVRGMLTLVYRFDTAIGR